MSHAHSNNSAAPSVGSPSEQQAQRERCALATGSAFFGRTLDLGAEMDRALQPLRLCVDCEHHKRIRSRKAEFHVCLLRLHEIKIDPVTGERRERYTNCQIMRRHENLCGVTASHFSPLNNKVRDARAESGASQSVEAPTE